MANEPLETILNRDLSRVAAKELIDRFCPLLDGIVNYGTNLYARAAHGIQDMLSEPGVPLLIYLNVLEMTDATSELFRESVATPAIPNIRATFEATLAFEYIFEADSTNRAHAWLVGYLSEQLEWTNMMLGTEKAGQQFHAAMQSDSVGANINLAPYQALATKRKAEFEAELKKPELAAALAERSKLLQKNPYPHWYTSFGGPRNLRELAKALDQEAQYLVLYKFFSGVAHGQNLHRFVKRTKSTDPLSRLLRDAADFDQLAIMAISFGLRCTRILSNQHSEMQQFGNWYVKEIKPGFAP